MSSAREIALAVLPHFRSSVLARRAHNYGYYAAAIGRNPKTESMVIGPAMHAIGGICAIAGIPIAPLFFVKRQDGAWRKIFEEDPLESRDVLPHYKILYVTARDHPYSEKEFERIAKGLNEVVPKDWGPHLIWHVAVATKPKNSEETYWERSLRKYQQLYEDSKAKKQ